MRKNPVVFEVDERVKIIAGSAIGSCGVVAWRALDAVWITLDFEDTPLPFAYSAVQKESQT